MSTPERPRRILLADCDSYFVRCAMLADPEGAGRSELVLVGGRAESRGVVTSASYGCRRFGISAGMPMASAVRLCPQAVVRPVPGEMVRRKHLEVRAVLDEFAPVVEAASVDEFYLDLTGTEELYRQEPLEDTARRIQATVLERTGISLSIGASTQRLLAKMAATVNKPMGVHVVPPGGEAEFIQRFPVEAIPGVGPSFAEALARRGVTTVRQLLPLEEATLVSWVGEGRGRWLYELARGRGSEGRVTARAPQKSVSHERTFPRDLTSDEEIEAALLLLVTETGASLRKEGHRARTVTVRVRDADFTDRSASRTVPDPIESDRALHAVALPLLRELRGRRRVGIRLLHVGVSKLGGEDEADLTLFELPTLESGRDRKLSEVSDRLRSRFGKGALLPGRIAGVYDGDDGRDERRSEQTVPARRPHPEGDD